MKGISVIICCYNSGTKLIPTLGHLAKQQPLKGFDYELILVDNNCTDNTIDIARTNWQQLGAPFLLSLVQQPKSGLTYAREMGVAKARFDYLVFCDDDNWLCEDYLGKVFQLMEAMPELALVGGVGEAVADIALPRWFMELNGFGYAVGDEGRKTGYVDSVYGAGMGIRKSVFIQLMNDGFSFILSDRTGISLSSGGDTELCMLVKNAGHKIYLDHALSFKHFLSSSRLQWRYYLKLRKSFGKAVAYLQLYAGVNKEDQFGFKKSWLKQWMSLAKYTTVHLKYFLFPSFFQNADCANFVQQKNMRLTLLTEYKKMNAIGRRMVSANAEKPVLQNAAEIQ